MTRKQKIALAATTSIALLLLFSVTLLPVIVRSKTVKALQEATGRTVRIEKIVINPFTLTVTVKGFGIQASDGAPFVSLGSLRVSLGGASLLRRALIIDEVRLDSPSISFARLAANRYSFNDIIERQKAKPPQKSSGELRYSINNISIHNGSIDFDDQAVAGGKLHTVKKLEVALPFISNIPYLLETYTDPKLAAIVDEAPFSFSGKVKPLSKSRETDIRIQLKQLSLPRYAAYSPVKLPVELASAVLTIDSQIQYRISADTKPELTISGLLKLDNVQINLHDGRSLLKLPALQVKAKRLELFARQFAFDAILLDGVELSASRDKQGVWMYAALLPPPAAAAPAATSDKHPAAGPATAAQPALFSVASLAISNGALHFSDAVPTGGFKTDLTEIDLAIKNLSTAEGTSAEYELSMLQDQEATLAVDGSFALAPLTATAAVEISDLRLQRSWPYLAQFLTAPVKGSLDAALQLSYNRDNGVAVSTASLALKGLSTRYGFGEGVDLGLLELSGASYSQKQQRAVVEAVRLSKGSVALSREQDGSISLLSLFRKGPKTAKATPRTASAAAKRGPAGPPLSWSLKRLQLERFTTSFTDRTRPKNPTFTLKTSQLSLTNLNGPHFTPAGLKFAGFFNEATPLKASGMLTPQPFHYKGDLSIGRLQLRDFEEYFPASLKVFILAGAIDTALKLDIALKNGQPVGSFSGNGGIRSFHAVDAVAEEDLLKWESLQLDAVRGTLAPFALSIGDVALNNVYSRIVIRKDGTLNLQNLVEKTPAQGAVAAAAADGTAAQPVLTSQSASSAAPATVAATTPITIGAVSVQAGTLAFTDRHLPQTFNSTFYNLGGRVSGLSSEAATLADVDLRGNLENHSPLQITGRINPLRSDLFVDLKVSFQDIDLSPITPYSGTYLGYTVEKGKLFLDLNYLIDKKQLNSENRVFIDQFTFGSPVASEKATSLPVRLAVALLKDRKGEIHLDLPVTGRTDDPKFSIWGVVWQVFKNLIVKAATSPFALLSSLGGGGQDFSSVPFAAGSNRLSAEEEQKLTALAKVLADRPGIKLEIKGYVERERDAEGYRREQLQQKLRSEKFLLLAKRRQLKEGETADTLQIQPDEAAQLLKAVYKKEKFPKPRNAIGLVKDLPDDEMRKLIIANTIVGEQELQGLARERATAVMNYLVVKGGLPAVRLFQKNDDIHKAPEKTAAVRSRVEFNAIAQ